MALDTETREDSPTEVLGDSVPAPRGSWRDRIRSKRGTRELYRAGVFVVGLLFLLGVAFIALHGG